MSDPITFDHVRAVVADIVEAAGPDYAYVPQDAIPTDEINKAGCFYAHAYGCRPGPGCLVGQTLVRLGVAESRLAAIDTDPSHFVQNAHDLTYRLINDGTLTIAPCVRCENGGDDHQCDADAIVSFLQTIQAHQDGGQTWAEALRLASVD